VRAGEPIVYASRKTHREQDWLKMPVAGIGPDDVRAYAAWLDHSGQLPGARLCTDYEWERAARGADDREFPHGYELDPGEANFDETYGKDVLSAGPDRVGSHPLSESPFSLFDMAGNAFEWVESSLRPGELVVRGGNYFMGAIAARSTNRSIVDASFRDPGIGARICAAYRGSP
jgi:formylglycine-generating enzyme required for sulfatase activity